MMSYRQQFHLMPETGFLNDPNGLCRFDGEYHIFHQYAPEGPGPAQRLGPCFHPGFLHLSQRRNGAVPGHFL